MSPRAIPAVLLACASLVGCATGGGMPIGGSSYRQGADFSAYRTFDFVPVPAGGSRIAASLAYFGIDGVLSRDLEQVGLARSIGGSPDVLVAYYQGGKPVDVALYGYSASGDPVIDVADVPSSCLVVDVVDAASRVLVWRGVATDALASTSSLDPAVRQMLQSWPGRQAQ